MRRDMLSGLQTNSVPFVCIPSENESEKLKQAREWAFQRESVLARDSLCKCRCHGEVRAGNFSLSQQVLDSVNEEEKVVQILMRKRNEVADASDANIISQRSTKTNQICQQTTKN